MLDDNHTDGSTKNAKSSQVLILARILSYAILQLNSLVNFILPLKVGKIITYFVLLLVINIF